jgi:hypothetical protein
MIFVKNLQGFQNLVSKTLKVSFQKKVSFQNLQGFIPKPSRFHSKTFKVSFQNLEGFITLFF